MSDIPPTTPSSTDQSRACPRKSLRLDDVDWALKFMATGAVLGAVKGRSIHAAATGAVAGSGIWFLGVHPGVVFSTMMNPVTVYGCSSAYYGLHACTSNSTFIRTMAIANTCMCLAILKNHIAKED
ncbi:Aste57867_8987 [Aphanomyces stellatus]|uniref:Aste57867_8987 protein n=1 Tax=Aphanomyces stellatus TaxID=120398 RepID=A0A485KLW4_9STRA|nr:hypothetical protein As57867_008952 [Aphanomyces stellatus]VFT85871.1 Aste57867_8987 [Aphanomyces stellatus]